MRYHFRSSEADFSAKKPIQRKKYHFTESIILPNGPHLTSWKLLYNFSRILALILPSHLSIATMYFRQRASGSYLAFTHANLERVSVRQWFRQWILRRGSLDWSHIDRTEPFLLPPTPSGGCILASPLDRKLIAISWQASMLMSNSSKTKRLVIPV